MADGLNRLRDSLFLLWRLPWIMVSLLLGTAAFLGALFQPPVPDPFTPTGTSVPTWLRYPIERNPHLRLPFISSNLHSLGLSLDGRTGLAVGENGTILKTMDRGDNWTPRTSGTSEALNSVAISADGRTALAVGNNGTILKTTDGGDKWTPRTNGTSEILNSVVISADGRTALAVGNNGTILKTTDGGDNWTPRTSGTSEALNSVVISTDGRTALAVGWNGAILQTTDGGDSWTKSTSGTSDRLTSVAVSTDGRTALAVGTFGMILKTTDGGDNWTPRASGTSEALVSVAISSDGRTGLAVGQFGTILKTTDGGDSWTKRTSGTSEILNSVSADGPTALAAGNYGTILKTTDGGNTWTARMRDPSDRLTSVAVSTDGRTALAVGNSGTILKTTDSGNTWTVQSSGTSESLTSVAVSTDGRTGLAVGSNGTILKTTDSGNTWTGRPSGTSGFLGSVALSNDGRTGLAVGKFALSESDTILKTADSGDTWTKRPSGTSENSGASLDSVAISADGRTSLAVGQSGTVVKTTDDGDNWTVRTSGTSAFLDSVTFSADGRTGLAVGQWGTILETTDGGDSWTKRTSGTPKPLYSVAMSADGRTALAVGDSGTILITKDGGDNWMPRTVGTSEPLYSVAMSADGRTALAVGWDGTLLTADGGETWRLLNAVDDYRKYPAPWTWIVFVLAVLALLPAFRSPPPPPVSEGISHHLVSDRPVEAGDPDPLQRRSIACTLSRFLRNENTEPPMTIAVTGDWGEGKSSLMNLVKAELEKNGTRTVWFNAWHHQKEQHLFAALLQAVRAQAIPSTWTLRGLGFRWRLVASRARRYKFWTFIALVLAGWSIHTLFAKPDIAFCIFQSLRDLKFGGISEKEATPVIPLVASLWITCRGFAAALKRSGVNPGRLLAAASGAFRVKAFGDQLGFRHRFGEAFKEVAEALQPNTLLILIDDLDRCRPEQVVETLEAVNFLVSAGPCYVVMGIAPEQVMYCVGLGFKEIAAEMAEAPNNDQDPEAWAREKRRDYARNYLEKLINIEVPIPELTDKGAGKLAEPVRSNGSPSEIRRGLWHFVRRLAAFAVVLAILSAGYVGARMYQDATTTPDQSQGSIDSQPPPTPSPEPSHAPDPGEESPPETGGAGGVVFRLGADDRTPWWIPLLALLLVFAIGVAIAVYIWRQQEDRIQDSPAFTKALRIWHPLVRARTNSPRRSPRQIKRFINRVRYLAMACESVADGTHDQPGESLIVAFAALQSISRNDPATQEQSLPTDLANLLAPSFRFPGDQSAAEIRQQLEGVLEKDDKRGIEETILSAILNHRNEFPDEAVTEQILSRFHEMALGIVVR